MSDPVGEAVAAAEAGRLIVIPTDTVYGIATRADDAAATRKLFEAKGRSVESELPVFVASSEDAFRVGDFDDRARALAGAFWPGGLTIVVPRSLASSDWSLGGAGQTIGLRIPGHPLARAVAAGVGALAISSANESGTPVLESCEELSAVFGDVVDVFLCEEQPIKGAASTVVDLSGGALRLVREGSISFEAVERTLTGFV